MITQAQALSINKSYSALFRRFIPTNNIVFLAFCPSITTPYGKDSGGLIADTVFLPTTLRIPTANFKRITYGAFVTDEKIHVAGGMVLNIFKAQSVSFVDAKMEIADAAFHIESMVTNAMLDTVNYIENDLLSIAINNVTQINATSGTASGKTYKGAKITERSIDDEFDLDTILLKNNAKFMTSRIEGSLAFGTRPIPLSFVEITSSEASQATRKTYDATGKFVSAVEYGYAERSKEAINNQHFESGYIRSTYRRIFTTNNFPALSQPTVDGGTDKVYSSLIMAADAIFLYMPSNRLIEAQIFSKQITDSDKTGDKVRFALTINYGIVNDVYGHAIHFHYLGKP